MKSPLSLLSFILMLFIVITAIVQYLNLWTIPNYSNEEKKLYVFASTKNTTYPLIGEYNILYDSIRGEFKYTSEKIDKSNLAIVRDITPEQRIKLIEAERKLSKEWITFWVKIIASALFSLVAFYIIISGKYPPSTRKWAFSVLTLIAGVWIGTVA